MEGDGSTKGCFCVKLILIRHGQTVWNKEQIFRGREDIPLDATGQAQAEATAAVLAPLHLAAVLSSPVSRARETAEACARPHQMAVEVRQSFEDIHVGSWAGVSLEHIRATEPELFQLLEDHPESFRFPEGETLAQVTRRAEEETDRLARQFAPDDAVLVVSHRVVTKMLLLKALGLGPEAFWRLRQDPCAINILNWGETHRSVCLMNDTCHLVAVGLHSIGRDF